MSGILRSVLCVGVMLVVGASLAIIYSTANQDVCVWAGVVGLILSAMSWSALGRLARSRADQVDDIAGYPMQMLRRNSFMNGR